MSPRCASSESVGERPPEVKDRAVPGNWEGDLVIGKQNQTAIGATDKRATVT